MSSTKLEVFKILLQSNQSYPSFQKLVTASVQDSNSFVFMELFRKFINKLDIGEYHKDDKKKKAFAGYDIHRTETSDPTINFHSESCIIEGIIEGGKFGKR
ncbi:MAG: hypothetical protein O9353_15350, partial [Bacteroidia bacterium]|nr:hypothetical protein [Bacteroidia bacterium]